MVYQCLPCIGGHIREFMSYYREKFSNATVLPKMHMLEEHVIPWLEKNNVGFGLLGEQGVEGVHAHFNKYGRTYGTMRDPVELLRQLMKEHLLHISPENVAATPEVQKRKKKRTATTTPED